MADEYTNGGDGGFGFSLKSKTRPAFKVGSHRTTPKTFTVMAATTSNYYSSPSPVTDGFYLNSTSQSVNKTLSAFADFFNLHTEPKFYPNDRLIPAVVILGTLDLLTLIGNTMLIVAILAQPSLRRSVFNRTIVSMGITGILVSLFVMPLSLINEISEVWFLGDFLCTVFTSLDVNFCTASIFHLVAIAIDRYLSATRVQYFHERRKWINSMLVAAWLGAALLSLLPVMGWRNPRLASSKSGQCLVSGDPSFAIFGTTVAFFVPTFFIIAIYIAIYVEVRRRIRRHLAVSSHYNELSILGLRPRRGSSSLRASQTIPTSYYASHSSASRFEMRRSSSAIIAGANGLLDPGNNDISCSVSNEGISTGNSTPASNKSHGFLKSSRRPRLSSSGFLTSLLIARSRRGLAKKNGTPTIVMAPVPELDHDECTTQNLEQSSPLLPWRPGSIALSNNNNNHPGCGIIANGSVRRMTANAAVYGSSAKTDPGLMKEQNHRRLEDFRRRIAMIKKLRYRNQAIKKRPPTPRRLSLAMALMAMAGDDDFDQSEITSQQQATETLSPVTSTPPVHIPTVIRHYSYRNKHNGHPHRALSKEDSGIIRNSDSVVPCVDVGEVSVMSMEVEPPTPIDLASTFSDRSVFWKQRERRMAAISLSVTLAFIICWLPYFLIELAVPLCGCYDYLPAHPLIRTSVNWLGYCNSLLNPFIYTLSSVEFRNSFRTLLKTPSSGHI